MCPGTISLLSIPLSTYKTTIIKCWENPFTCAVERKSLIWRSPSAERLPQSLPAHPSYHFAKWEKNNKRVCLLVSFSLQFLPSLSHFQTQVSALLCPSCLKCVLTLSAPDGRVRPPCLRCNGSSVPYSQPATCVPLTDEGLCVCVASDTRCPRYWKIIIRFVCVCVYVPDNHSGRACWYSSVVPGVTGSRITAQEITIILSPKCTQASTCTPVFGERANNANDTLIFLIRQKWHLGLGCKSDLLYYLKPEPNPI